MNASSGDLLMKILAPRQYQHEIRQCIAGMQRVTRVRKGGSGEVSRARKTRRDAAKRDAVGGPAAVEPA